ncbi:ferredoxin--NADP reductase [Fusibacter sp. JL298sf-3]
MSCACNSETRHLLKLSAIERHNPETVSFDFVSDTPLKWFEGDSSKVFVKIGAREVGKKFSYATLPEESIIRFTTRIKSERSAYKESLRRLGIGDCLEVTPPSGHFRLIREDRPIVLLSNGVGIAAVRALVKRFEADQTGIPSLMQINVDRTGAIYGEEFCDIAEGMETFASHYTENRSQFYGRLDYEVQQLLTANEVTPYIYVVGSDAFVGDTIQYLKSVGFDDSAIVTDGPAAGGSCGCSSTGGCGCGANLITSIEAY